MVPAHKTVLHSHIVGLIIDVQDPPVILFRKEEGFDQGLVARRRGGAGGEETATPEDNGGQ